MKRITLLLAFMLLYNPLEVTASINWMTSLEDAKTLSKALNKPILVDFWANWCGPCKQMDRDVWSNEEINALVNNFVTVKIDIDYNKSLAQNYNVRAIPNILIIDGWGNILYTSVGYKDKNEIEKLLKNFSINMTSVYGALSILEKDDSNVYSNVRVAQKFQNIAFVLEGKSRDAFLERSNYYLRASSKLIPEDDIAFIEKVDLLKLLNKAFSGSAKSALKSLDKDFVKRDVSNEALYYFVEFYCYHFEKNTTKADELYTKLIDLNDAIYLEKVAYLLKDN